MALDVVGFMSSELSGEDLVGPISSSSEEEDNGNDVQWRDDGGYSLSNGSKRRRVSPSTVEVSPSTSEKGPVVTASTLVPSKPRLRELQASTDIVDGWQYLSPVAANNSSCRGCTPVLWLPKVPGLTVCRGMLDTDEQAKLLSEVDDHLRGCRQRQLQTGSVILLSFTHAPTLL